MDLDSSPTSQNGVQQSSDFWFADGSVVLQAEHTRFQVHQGILARHSPFFRDMFSLPGTSEQPRLDGVPIIDVMDSAADWICIFTLLYESVRSPSDFGIFQGNIYADIMRSANDWLEKLSLFQALTLVRIARKYQFDKIYQYAMRRLDAAFPRAFETFINVHQDHLSNWASYVQCDCGEICDAHDAIKFINCAVEWDITAILPVAYFLLCGLGVKEVLRGIEHQRYNLSISTRPPAVLCRYAQEALLIGQRELEHKFYKLVLPWSFNDGPKCLVGSAGICSSESSSCLEKFQAWEQENLCRPLIPDHWPWIFMQQGTNFHFLKLCRSCEAVIEDHFQKSQLKLWEELPGIFGLSSWEIIATNSALNV